MATPTDSPVSGYRLIAWSAVAREDAFGVAGGSEYFRGNYLVWDDVDWSGRCLVVRSGRAYADLKREIGEARAKAKSNVYHL